MPTSASVFGTLLRKKRNALGIGVVEFAKGCKIDPGLLSRIESGKRPPPQMPGLVRFANQLKISLDSEEFAELLAAADHDRNPSLHQMALEMRGGKLWNPFAKAEKDEVLCSNLGELVSKAAEQAIRVEAAAITVHSPSGRATTYRLDAKQGVSQKKKRK
jgi:transcriptional regulator with XRE-family HTH domain